MFPAGIPSFVVLAMIASVEAIFLSTFVLISQNRMARRRTSETTSTCRLVCSRNTKSPKLTTLVSGIADRLEVRTEADAELEEITRDVAPDAVLDEIEATKPRSK